MLQELRKKRGVTQKDLARRLGVHGQFISNVERGVCELPIKHYPRTAKLLKVSVGQLIEYRLLKSEAKIRKALSSGGR